MSEEYRFTTDWFTYHIDIWRPLIDLVKPKKILEIGSFEGRSTTFTIEEATKYSDELEIHCVDTWQGGVEHAGIDFGAVEARFWQNIKLAKHKVPGKKVNLTAHKGTSVEMLAKLVTEGHLGTFDWVLIDGSHAAVDVFYDAVLAFRLAKVHSALIFDDYNVPDAPNLDTNLGFPKVAIDAFAKIHYGKIALIPMMDGVTGKPFTEKDLYQLYLTKIAE